MNKLTLTCNVTGKQVTYTSAEYIAKRIEQAGSLENLIKTYVCRGANRVEKKQKPSKEKKPAKPSAREERTFNGKKILIDNVVDDEPKTPEWKTKTAQVDGDKMVFLVNGKKVSEMTINHAGNISNKSN